MSLKFSYPLIFRQLIGMIHRSFDKVMLTKYSNLDSVGFYAIGGKISTVMKVLMDAVGKTWNPFFQTKAKENNNDSKLIVADRYIEMSFFNNDWFFYYML